MLKNNLATHSTNILKEDNSPWLKGSEIMASFSTPRFDVSTVIGTCFVCFKKILTLRSFYSSLEKEASAIYLSQYELSRKGHGGKYTLISLVTTVIQGTSNLRQLVRTLHHNWFNFIFSLGRCTYELFWSLWNTKPSAFCKSRQASALCKNLLFNIVKNVSAMLQRYNA